jgi:hypothetical protein
LVALRRSDPGRDPDDGGRPGRCRAGRPLARGLLGGLGRPFLLVALFGTTAGILRAIGSRLPVVSGISGGVMLATGAIMLLGLYQQFFARVVALAPWTPLEPGL